MRGSYYNEIDPFAAEMLRNLIAAGHIAPGDVDERRTYRPYACFVITSGTPCTSGLG